MSEQPYENEDVLQELLESYPELLAGDQIDTAAPRRLILISREVGVPGEDEGFDRWSLDHLFIDQDGVPTLVEVKRSTDTRIRREVVGQMLDYAANAVVYWPAEKLRAKFEANCMIKGNDPSRSVQSLLNLASDDAAFIDAFWNTVKTNLQAGRIRMVFLADKIPTELQRIVEFLNSQMDPAEVLAIELRQFVGSGFKTMVPRVFGLTATATAKKGAGPRETQQWDEPSFFQELASEQGVVSVDIARAILNWSSAKMSSIWWGRGKELGSFVPVLEHGEKGFYFFAVWTNGTVEIHFQYLQRRPPFDREQNRLELMRRLNLINGFNFTKDMVTRRPTRSLSLLKDPNALQKFQEAIEWGLSQVQAVH
jgi:hypothetical protein